MAYMTRLGTQGYDSMTDLIKNLMDAGLGASELYACALKAAGMYMGRCCHRPFAMMQRKLTASRWQCIAAAAARSCSVASAAACHVFRALTLYQPSHCSVLLIAVSVSYVGTTARAGSLPTQARSSSWLKSL